MGDTHSYVLNAHFVKLVRQSFRRVNFWLIQRLLDGEAVKEFALSVGRGRCRFRRLLLVSATRE